MFRNGTVAGDPAFSRWTVRIQEVTAGVALRRLILHGPGGCETTLSRAG